MPTLIPPVAGDIPGGLGPGWSLIQEWDAGVGDLTAIDTAFSSAGGFAGLIWSPDGTLLTLCSTGDDTVKTFTCSTAFDPDTATETATRAVTNPRIMGADAAGTMLFINTLVGDLIENYPFTGHTIGAGAVTSDITKAEAGFVGSADGAAAIGPDADYILWAGPNTDEYLKYITTPGGDLDSFTVDTSHLDNTVNPTLVVLYSPITADGLLWIEGVAGTPAIRFLELTDPLDVTTLSVGANQSLAALSSQDPIQAWFDPSDTSEIWTVGSAGADIQLSRFATNMPAGGSAGGSGPTARRGHDASLFFQRMNLKRDDDEALKLINKYLG